MRLFTAVNFSDETKHQILEVREQLRSQALRGNFTKSENLHLTLVFLGETPEEKIAGILRIIEDIKISPFEITFNSTGCFKRGGKELWWIGAEPPTETRQDRGSFPGNKSPGLAALKDIHSKLVSRFQEAGLSFDTKPFKAHITLGREIVHSQPIILDRPEITIRVERVSLMKSEQTGRGVVYTELGMRNEERPSLYFS